MITPRSMLRAGHVARARCDVRDEGVDTQAGTGIVAGAHPEVRQPRFVDALAESG